MAGKIEYALGLDSSNFLGKIAGANQAVQLFTFAVDIAGKALRGSFATIERGGALQDLSNRTRETVGDLFQLQYAFQQSGVEAGAVPSILQKYRAALGGVGEMGENTAAAFAALGLSITDLSRLSGPDALEKIFGGLNQLDRNKAAGVAGALFGRGLSGDILQLAGDSKDFGENLREAARQANIMAANAPMFDKFGDTLGRLKLQTEGLFLDLAVKITPILQGALDTLMNPGSIESFGEKLELSLTVGFGESVNFFSRSLQRVFAALPEMFVGVVNVAAGLFLKSMGNLISGPFGEMFAAMLPAGMGHVLKYFQAQGIDPAKLGAFIQGTGVDFLKSGIKTGQNADVVDIVDLQKERARLAQLFPALAGLAGPGGGVVGGDGINAGTALRYKAPENESVNALRRIGFGSGSQSDGLAVQRKQLNVLETLSNKTTKLIEVCGMDKPLRVLND